MKKHWMALAALAGAMVSQAQAQTVESSWLWRLRAAHVDMRNSDNSGQGLSADNKTMAELDFSYFFSRSMAAELNLSAPERHTLSSSGAAIGTFQQMPTTLMAQFHFVDLPGYKPYVGLGLNYTRFSSVNLGGLTLESHSWGPALQLGVDVPLDKNWLLNLDLKKLYVRTDLGGTASGTLKLDPLMAGVGIGYKF